MVCGKHGKVTDAMIKKISVSTVSSPYGKLTEDYGINLKFWALYQNFFGYPYTPKKNAMHVSFPSKTLL